MRSLEEILSGVYATIDEACIKSGRSSHEVQIVAVTKTHGPEVVEEAWRAGLQVVGENKVQEAAWKQPLVCSGPEWHLIGHLQKNKVRQALSLFSVIHSVDSVELVEKLQSVAADMGVRPQILLEVNVSGERSKNGLPPTEVPRVIESALNATNLSLVGFMTMAPFTPEDKIEEVRPVFAGLRELRDTMQEKFDIALPQLSMGMTNDYRIAVEEGATWVRLGTCLFGERPRLKMNRVAEEDESCVRILD